MLDSICICILAYSTGFYSLSFIEILYTSVINQARPPHSFVLFMGSALVESALILSTLFASKISQLYIKVTL